jgi:hypothetical protein
MRPLKFKLSDTTLVSDVNQTLSNLLSQVNKTNKTVSGVSQRVTQLAGSSPTPDPDLTPAGTNVADLPSTTMGNHGTGLNTDAVTYSFLVCASGIVATPAKWTITVNVATGPIAWQNWVVARTLPGSLTVIDYTPITWGGTQNPTMSTGLNTSDPVALQIDTAHDYWFMAYSVHQTGKLMYSYVAQYGTNSEGGVITGGTGQTSPYFNDYTNGAVGSPNTIVPPNTAYGLWLSPWQAA